MTTRYHNKDITRDVRCPLCHTEWILDSDEIAQGEYWCEDCSRTISLTNNTRRAKKPRKKHPKRRRRRNSSIQLKMNQFDLHKTINVNHPEFVKLYYNNKVNIFIHQFGVCQLCANVMSDTPSQGMDYRSAHLWFWLLPALSLLSFFWFSWYISLFCIIITSLISIFQIGPAVRKAATDCVIEAVLLDEYLYDNLVNQKRLFLNYR